MVRSVTTFAGGLALGASITMFSMPAAYSAGQAQARTTPQPGSSVVQLRLYTIDKGHLDDFATAWRAGVYPLRTKMGYQIPFAAKIPETNQFVWVLAYDGPQSWEQKEAEYYGSADRKRLAPDPAQWIARPEQLMIKPVIGLPPKGQ